MLDWLKILFEGEGGSGGGDGGAAGGGGEGGSGSGGDGGGEPNKGGAGAGAEDKTFKQEDVDRIVKDRLKRERQQKYGDYDELKTKASKFDELEEANRSELEKAQAAEKKAREESAAALDVSNSRLIKAEVKLQSVELGIVDSDAAYALMSRDDVKVDDDGNVEGVKKSLEALLKEKPFLKGEATPTKKPSADGGARPAGGDKGIDNKTRLEQIKAKTGIE